MQQILQKQLGNGVHITAITTDKFRTSMMRIGILAPCGSEDACAYAVLPYILRRGTAANPDMQTLGWRTDMLYGAQLEPFMRKHGETLMLGMQARVIDDKYTSDAEGIIEQTIKLLTSFFTKPKLVDGAFDSAYTATERDNLADRIEALQNDPRSWSSRRAQEIMCAGERYGSSEYGTAQQARKLTPQKVYEVYQQLLAHAPIELFYCGSTSAEQVCTLFANAFAGERGQILTPPPTEILAAPRGDTRYVTEQMAVKQGKLVFGLRTGITAAHNSYPAMMMMNHILGGSVGSKLFLNVREKRSLCYYASSVISKFKGIMLISAGIDNNALEQAKAEILHQLLLMQQGEITDQEIEATRLALQNILRQMQDSVYSLENFWSGQAAAGFTVTPQQLSAALDTITRDEIISAAHCVKLDTIYFLKGDAQ